MVQGGCQKKRAEFWVAHCLFGENAYTAVILPVAATYSLALSQKALVFEHAQMHHLPVSRKL